MYNLIIHLNSYQVWHRIVDRSSSRVSLHQPSSLPYRMHSCGHCYQSRQASCHHGRSCNWSWSTRLGDGSSYVSVLSRSYLYFLTGQVLQTTSFKVIDSTFSRTLAAPLPLITLGPFFPSSTCRLYSSGSFPPPTLP